ncbi:hypothetical protein CSUI_009407, partial [Cystoisospora suis]
QEEELEEDMTRQQILEEEDDDAMKAFGQGWFNFEENEEI